MIIGQSEPIQRLREDISYAARADAKVLITGESGSGKELVANAIHGGSARKGGPFVAINCAGLPETLLESELFGYLRGSFTGAYRDRPGLLETGHGGTVFLDEVGEMTFRMQGLLLRFLETGELQRIGADRVQHRVDVRIIAATNRLLTDEIEQKRFRVDLFYRLNVVHLMVAPLRQRREDVPLLMRHFLEKYAASYRTDPPELTQEALDRLMAYSWPGNVRELKNVVERIVVRRARVITREMLPDEILATPAQSTDGARTPDTQRSEVANTLERLLSRRETFWSAVYDPFMARDLTREDLRAVIRAGLEQTRGSYTVLTQLFNMEPSDYKRFLNFLRKHQCHMPFHRYRVAPSSGRDEHFGAA
jgi:transcriptional regulator with PAS, ATPase and Fis domain